MRRRFAFALGLALALAGCGPKPEAANPALWRIDGANGERGWLFGTIHTLPRPVAWQTAPVADALDNADRLVVEIAALGDDAATAATLKALATTPGQPPLSARVPAALHGRLSALLAKAGRRDGEFGETETWAAALALAQAAQGEAGAHPEWGIDRALLRLDKPVEELEGAKRQLGIFDRLPEADQRGLLEAVVSGAEHADADAAEIAKAWREGDMALLERETRTGMLARPGLRKALFSARNLDWARRIDRLLRQGAHPFVAVGAAHMAGPEGLPALLAERGWRVTRIE